MNEWRSWTLSRVSSICALLVSSILLTGCSRLLATYDVAPSGLTRTDDQLRRFLAFGKADSALLHIAKPKKQAQLPKDELLRVLYEGLTAHYARDYARSTAAFDVADYLADDRMTKSLTKAALSLMVNDLSLAWQPSRTERLLIPYYGALSYLHAGNYRDAAVEARRLSYLLQIMQDDGRAPPAELHAFLRNFAGVVFEVAGYRADADVAYRNAVALDSLRYRKLEHENAGTTGEVVVLVEHGFAPYRVQESLIVTLSDHDAHEFDDDDDERRRESSLRLAARVLQHANTSGPRVGAPRSRTLVVPAPVYEKSSESEHHHHRRRCDSDTTRVQGQPCEEDDEEDHSYLLRMSWPVMYDYEHSIPAVSVLIDSTVVTADVRADIARGVLEDFQRQQAAITARAIARAVAKYAMTKGLEKEAGKKNEGLGQLAGTLANIGGAITEQADTRSWHFVPRSISLVRYSLPPGTHHIRVDHGNGAPIDLGSVTVAAGRVRVLSTRVWN